MYKGTEDISLYIFRYSFHNFFCSFWRTRDLIDLLPLLHISLNFKIRTATTAKVFSC